MAKRAVEQTGLIPRSIIRTFERFKKQLFPGVEMLVIQEFRISRYQVIVSIQALLMLIFIPILINVISKHFIITPFVKYIWNKNNVDIFLNIQQQELALTELKQFEEKLYFESLLTDFASTNLSTLQFQNEISRKTVEIANLYNDESIEAISNLFSDFLSLASLAIVFIFSKTQLIILKSFLLILSTDLLVGFHSPRGWEVFLKWVFYHFGLPENTEFMSLFVATFPVFLDTIFKYWIFRSLNKISPSTVATYHNMIE